MTFEEFFTKKKIDLVQLEKVEPALYSEFKKHFAAMGEKSFDHTKKFWFNKLRRLYHLTPPDKAVTQVETAIASQAEPLSSPTIEQKPAFTPRFKSANINKAEPAPAEQAEAKPVAKPAFKPRNIPAKPVEPAAGEKQAETINTPPAKAPEFKPRNIKPADESPKAAEPGAEENGPETPGNSLPPKSPGFRPRNIKSVASENAEDANRADSRPGQPAVSETPITNPAKQEEAAKGGYKPKFKLKNIPRNPAAGEEQTGQPVKPELMPESLPEIQTDAPVESEIERKISSSTHDKTPEQEIQDNDQDSRGSDDEIKEEKPKPAYKPKFNLKNIKPRDDKNL
ncbi:hypothetical protein ACFSJU_08945 [Paradesertivirga mongoliensis]|uniref:Uncharacterized protein n=1 Tax=Paradesertivirga mongoliensis TaxID=2100740 RepID=A0ABW4ZLN7_9SPHI|nr:hypothetical protein [Pedobacter mongoliensis]